MTIKQQGGVFGRNPTFNDADIDNNLSVGNVLNVDNGTLYVDPVNNRVGIGTTTPGSDFTLSDGKTMRLYRSGNAIYTDISYAAGTGLSINDANGDGIRFQFASSDQAYINANGLAFPSGKGIDFSATGQAPGMTSELLDDYEEGAWTPVVEGSTTAGTGTYANQIGLYTKVGRVVHFQCWLQVNSHTGTGVTLIKGLPFTSNSSNAKGTANLNYFANLTISASNTAGLQVANGQTYLVLKEFPVGGGLAGSVAIDPNMQINFSGSYTV